MDRMFLRGLPRAFARRVLPPFLPRLHRDWRRILACGCGRCRGARWSQRPSSRRRRL